MDRISVKNAGFIREVELRDCEITLEEFIAVAKYHAKVVFHKDLITAVNKSRSLLDGFWQQGRAIYGVTTGFGDNVRYTISGEDAKTLQENILRSHACAVGQPLDEEEVRAIILMIILNTAKGYSGIQEATLRLLRDVLNHRLYPFAPGSGSVGYLSVEAHIALTLTGEGYFLEKGEKVPSLSVLEAHQLKPVELGCKEGLLLISGTTSATALGLLALYHGIVSIKNTELSGALVYEALRATTKALDPRIHQLKRHPQQQLAASNLSAMLKGSAISEAYRNAKVQDASVLRAMPQILGACRKLIEDAGSVLLSEMHSVSDNPVLFPTEDGEGEALMTGNFDGSFVGTHCDMLAIAYANLANLIERCTDRLINHHINEGLPPFLITNPGLNNGFMIPQYTQAALTAELKLLAVPASTDSITTCAGQEDPVSMAYRACQKANESAKKLQTMAAIELLTALQAVDLAVAGTSLAQSPVLKKVRDHVREKVTFLEHDRYLYEDIETISEMVNGLELVRIVEDALQIVL